MKRLFVVMTAMIGICAIMPDVKAMSNTSLSETCYIGAQPKNVKVGDYVALGDGSVYDTISISVYFYPNNSYNYYAVVNGEAYAVRQNPDYNRNGYGYERYSHYIQYKNKKYYFSI